MNQDLKTSSLDVTSNLYFAYKINSHNLLPNGEISLVRESLSTDELSRLINSISRLSPTSDGLEIVVKSYPTTKPTQTYLLAHVFPSKEGLSLNYDIPLPSSDGKENEIHVGGSNGGKRVYVKPQETLLVLYTDRDHYNEVILRNGSEREPALIQDIRPFSPPVRRIPINS
jgi:hypothetical protein